MINTKIDKSCTSCGIQHKRMPITARIQYGILNSTYNVVGFFFDCICDNTIYVPLKLIFEKMAVS